jgi:hypothetical protein
MAGRTPAKQLLAWMANGCEPRSGVRSRGCPTGTSTALCTCAIGGCSDSRLFRHKARRAGKAHCLRQRRNTGAGQPGGALRVGWCALRAALRRLPRARAIACAPRLALNPRQPTAVANGTGAECFGGAFLSPVSLRISKKKSPGAIFRASPEGVRRRDAPNKPARARHRDRANPHASNRARNEPQRPASTPLSITQDQNRKR